MYQKYNLFSLHIAINLLPFVSKFNYKKSRYALHPSMNNPITQMR